MLPHYAKLHSADSRAFLEKVQPCLFPRSNFTGNPMESRLLKPTHLNKIRRLHGGKPCAWEGRPGEQSSQFSPKQLQPSWQQSETPYRGKWGRCKAARDWGCRNFPNCRLKNGPEKKKKEDFRHFMLDSHESLVKVTLSKKSLQTCTVCAQKKTLLCFVCHTWHLLPRQSPVERSPTGVPAAKRACGSTPMAASAAVVCWREGGKWNSLCRHSQGAKAAFWVSACLQQRGNGGRGCHAEQWSHPTPQMARWEIGVMWAGNGCIPRGVGQAFICCESMLCLWCWWVWLVGWSRSPVIIRWSQWNLLRHSAHLKIRLFMGLLSTESICTTQCGAVQVSEPKKANKWARKNWKEKLEALVFSKISIFLTNVKH